MMPSFVILFTLQKTGVGAPPEGEQWRVKALKALVSQDKGQPSR